MSKFNKCNTFLQVKINHDKRINILVYFNQKLDYFDRSVHETDNYQKFLVRQRFEVLTELINIQIDAKVYFFKWLKD